MSSTEFVIVGGGVYGCALAFELTALGHGVTVFEANTVAGGASGGLGKRGVRANERDLRELALMRLAYELWPSLDEMLGACCGYARTGHLLLAEHDRDVDSFAARAWMQSRQGIPSEVLDAAAVRALEPALAPGVAGALHCPLDGIADHTATTRAYAEAARRQGATVREGERVQRIEIENGRATAVIAGDGERHAATGGVAVLNNTGVAELLAAATGVTLPVWQALPQVMRTPALAEPPTRRLVGHASRVVSIKTLDDGTVMVSGGWRGRWNARGEGETVPAQVSGNWAQAVALYPALARTEVVEARADRPESMCIDGVPIIDQAPAVQNLWFATGWCGHGWAIAPAVAKLLAEWLSSGKPPPLLARFSLSRFG